VRETEGDRTDTAQFPIEQQLKTSILLDDRSPIPLRISGGDWVESILSENELPTVVYVTEETG